MELGKVKYIQLNGLKNLPQKGLAKQYIIKGWYIVSKEIKHKLIVIWN